MFVYVDNLLDYKRYVSYLSNYNMLALDTETYVLPEYKAIWDSATDPHTSRISLLTLKGHNTLPIVFDILILEKLGYDRQIMYELLNSREKLIGANIQFDAKFLKRHYGVLFENIWCIILMAKLIGNATGSKFRRSVGSSLSDLCRDFLNVHLTGKGSEQISDWYPRPCNKTHDSQEWQQWMEKVKYAANDTNYLLPLHDTFLPILCNPVPKSDLNPNGSENPPWGFGMEFTMKLDCNQMAAIAAEFEYNGLPVSKQILTDIQNNLWNKDEDTGRLVEVASKLADLFNLQADSSPFHEYKIPSDRTYKALNNPTKLKELVNSLVGTKLDNIQSSVMERLIDLLEQQKSISQENGSPETQIEFISEDEASLYSAILELEESATVQASEVCSLIVEYKRLVKQYNMDLRSHINPVTGCIHCHVDMLGAATGRSSSSGPNMQNISSRTHVTITRPLNNLFPSSANYNSLEPDWQPEPCKQKVTV